MPKNFKLSKYWTFVRTFLIYIDKILNNIANLLSNFIPLNKQFILYSIIGGISVSSDWLVYTLLFLLAHNIYVNFISYAIGTLVSFSLNSFVNFKVYDKLHLRYGKLLVVALFGSIFSTIIIKILVSLTINPIIAKILSFPIILVYQYTISKRFVYNKTTLKTVSRP